MGVVFVEIGNGGQSYPGSCVECVVRPKWGSTTGRCATMALEKLASDTAILEADAASRRPTTKYLGQLARFCAEAVKGGQQVIEIPTPVLESIMEMYTLDAQKT